jgi:hypothetical protein
MVATEVLLLLHVPPAVGLPRLAVLPEQTVAEPVMPGFAFTVIIVVV